MAIRGLLPMLVASLALTFSGCNEPEASGVDGQDGADGANAVAVPEGTDGDDGADGGIANAPSSTDAATITLSPENTTIAFVGTKDSGKHDGGFRELAGTLVLDGDAVQSISITVPTESLWADDNKLENHLKSRDFFEVSAHPELSFVAKQVEPASDGDGTHTITGDLTMLGETQAIDAPATIEISADKVNLASDFTIDRTQWGMDYGQGQVHNEVQISVKVDASR